MLRDPSNVSPGREELFGPHSFRSARSLAACRRLVRGGHEKEPTKRSGFTPNGEFGGLVPAGLKMTEA